MKRFVNGGVYRHVSCLDVDIQVLRVQYSGPKYTKLRILYHRRDHGSGGFLLDPQPETVTIQNENFYLWSRVA